jgi:hypothetical protein
LSSSEGAEFEAWIAERFAATRGFTALVLLIAMRDAGVQPISCSYVHVIGDEVTWKDMRAMLDASRRAWDAVALFAEAAAGGGPLIDLVAKGRLQERIDEVTMNRMVLNEAGFFDNKGRAIRIDPLETH